MDPSKLSRRQKETTSRCVAVTTMRCLTWASSMWVHFSLAWPSRSIIHVTFDTRKFLNCFLLVCVGGGGGTVGWLRVQLSLSCGPSRASPTPNHALPTCPGDVNVQVIMFDDTARVVHKRTSLSKVPSTLGYRGGRTCYGPALDLALQEVGVIDG